MWVPGTVIVALLTTITNDNLSEKAISIYLFHNLMNIYFKHNFDHNAGTVDVEVKLGFAIEEVFQTPLYGKGLFRR